MIWLSTIALPLGFGGAGHIPRGCRESVFNAFGAGGIHYFKMARSAIASRFSSFENQTHTFDRKQVRVHPTLLCVLRQRVKLNATRLFYEGFMLVVIAYQNPSFLAAFRDFLHVQGHDVEIASDGLSCLDALRRSRPDALAIGSDLLWGGSDGIISLIQEDPMLQSIPVLLLMGIPIRPRLPACHRFLPTVCYPFRLEDLSKRLNELVQMHPVRDGFDRHRFPVNREIPWGSGRSTTSPTGRSRIGMFADRMTRRWL